VAGVSHVPSGGQPLTGFGKAVGER
jgi:hypothetical protein